MLQHMLFEFDRNPSVIGEGGGTTGYGGDKATN